MKKSELENYRQILLDLRARLNGDLTQLAGAALGEGSTAGSAPADPNDLGSEAVDQEFTLSLLQSEGQALNQIEDALGRIKDGSYGTCLECGQPIPQERLQFLPHTAHCVQCARKLERR